MDVAHVNTRRGSPAIGMVVILLLVALSRRSGRYQSARHPAVVDGNPNLKAPAPKTTDGRPDCPASGGSQRGPVTAGNIAADGVEVPFQPWAEGLQTRLTQQQEGVPSERCRTSSRGVYLPSRPRSSDARTGRDPPRKPATIARSSLTAVGVSLRLSIAGWGLDRQMGGDTLSSTQGDLLMRRGLRGHRPPTPA
jgi:hypothetical protein